MEEFCNFPKWQAKLDPNSYFPNPMYTGKTWTLKKNKKKIDTSEMWVCRCMIYALNKYNRKNIMAMLKKENFKDDLNNINTSNK